MEFLNAWAGRDCRFTRHGPVWLSMQTGADREPRTCQPCLALRLSRQARTTCSASPGQPAYLAQPAAQLSRCSSHCLWLGSRRAARCEEAAVAFTAAPGCSTSGVGLFPPELNGWKAVLKLLLLPPGAVLF